MHEINVILIPMHIMGLWETTESIPKYINKLKELQQASVQANLPVTNASLVAIANKTMIVHRFFLMASSGFNKLSDSGRS